MRKRTNHKPAAAKVLAMIDRLVDFAESLPTQPSPAEDKRLAILRAADEAGYKHKIPR